MTIKRRALIAATTAIATALAGTHVATAEPALSTGVELGTTMDNTVAVDAIVNLADSRERGIPMLKKLRGEMWDLNVPFADGGATTIQEAARQYGLNTKEAYVNAVYSDPLLVAIAVQRAVEESAPREFMDHERPYNSQCGELCRNTWNAKVAGQQSWGENLAWNGADVGIDGMIYDQWGYGELAALKEANGVWNSHNGHLHTQLNPKYRGYGFGYVDAQVPNKAYKFTGATAAGLEDPLRRVDSLVDEDLLVTFYRTAYDGETPTGQKPREVLEGQKIAVTHTAVLWGGKGYYYMVPDEVDEDTIITVPVEGTLPSGESWVENRIFLVKNSLRDQIKLSYPQGRTVREGATIQIPLTSNIPLPSGTTVDATDGAVVSSDGTVTWQAPEVAADKDVTLTLTFKYPDGSEKESSIAVKVLDSMRDKYAPATPTGVFEVREDASISIDLTEALTGLPAGTTLSSQKGTFSGNVLTYVGESVDRDTELTVPVTVTYPDGSADEIALAMLVKNKLSDQYNPAFPGSITADENTTATITPLTKLADLPAGTTARLGENIPGATIASDGTITYNVGELNASKTVTIPVVYTFSDGSTKTVTVPVNLNDTTAPALPESSSTGTIAGIVLAVIALIGGAIAAFASGVIKL